ncbi:hypothetical protein ALC60_09770 [Trachymyrmex zeteki]|uniref:Uncharacterized protein n=1 Tax=Mycetomoellerius zeteki TaxID=64791 RepID=A0A151WTG1_9HYME|nr:hypothetical protein ALC60_09770 [Trachymyrmex zeteki]
MDPMDSGRRRKPSARRDERTSGTRTETVGWMADHPRRRFRGPPTSGGGDTEKKNIKTREISRPLPPQPPAVISLPVHATVAGTSTEQQVLPARCLRPAPKTSQPSRVNDVRPRGGNCPEAMQPPHSSADRATSDPPKPRELERGASYRE